MTAKQDRPFTRTPEQLERKYDLGRDYEQFRDLSTSARQSADRAESAYISTVDVVRKGFSTADVENEDTGEKNRAEFYPQFLQYFVNNVLKATLSPYGLTLDGDVSLTITSDSIEIKPPEGSENGAIKIKVESGKGYISGLTAPLEASQAVNKAYVDAEIKRLEQRVTALGG